MVARGSRSGRGASPGWNAGMSSILVASAVAFAAFYVWLAVGIVNRRPRRAGSDPYVGFIPTNYFPDTRSLLLVCLHWFSPGCVPLEALLFGGAGVFARRT